MKNPFIHVGRFYVCIQRMNADSYYTYFHNTETGDRCVILRALGILFVAVLKAVR